MSSRCFSVSTGGSAVYNVDEIHQLILRIKHHTGAVLTYSLQDDRPRLNKAYLRAVVGVSRTKISLLLFVHDFLG